MPTRFTAIDLGPLPVATINRALGTELEPGQVHLSAAARQHMAEDHPEDYAACMAALPAAIASPSFVGQAPGHTANFEMVRRIARPDGKAMLVAIGLTVDGAGRYRVRSCYLIKGEVITARRLAGRLTRPHFL